MQTFSLNGHEHIALCDLLKLSGLASSGGQAKAWIAEGRIRRNGTPETRKTAKIRAGEIIELDDGSTIEVQE
ncbi:RNA-binding S4 domain-containing protein [Eikenella sp. S3360]|uniref:RNA-binding S4 domain-containing protein n=2 Tax=Eikenella glucosivorans TaxID=2766967 RepID=A0ABS0NCV7_9NEIS|nr:RNA-binding S4 domain-containing protein [Eikenella glucosivorans]MBH5330094.1 RNA-binding S4 domain-containing protein [Eikenella glucosivorans]